MFYYCITYDIFVNLPLTVNSLLQPLPAQIPNAACLHLTTIHFSNR